MIADEKKLGFKYGFFIGLALCGALAAVLLMIFFF